MSFTNSTPNLKLPQWVGTDKPQFLTDINGAFSTIDGKVGEIELKQGQDDTQFESINTQLGTLGTSVSEANSNALKAQTDASAAQSTANNAVTVANSATLTAQGAVTTANEVKAQLDAGIVQKQYQLFMSPANIPMGNGFVINTTDQLGGYLELIFIEGLNILMIESGLAITQTVPITTNRQITTKNNKTFYFFPILTLPISLTPRTDEYVYISAQVDSRGTQGAIRNVFLFVASSNGLELGIAAINATIDQEIIQTVYQNFIIPLNVIATDISVDNWTQINDITSTS